MEKEFNPNGVEESITYNREVGDFKSAQLIELAHRTEEEMGEEVEKAKKAGFTAGEMLNHAAMYRRDKKLALAGKCEEIAQKLEESTASYPRQEAESPEA